jgi:hypothetical protein
MLRATLLTLLASAAFAQTGLPTTEKPPAEVDQALRTRVNEFYTFLKNHEFRKAEGLIAEDTKDYYYEGSKPEISKFEILDVEWTEGFTHARVITQCAQVLSIPGFPAGEMTLKVPSTWRLENGTWYLFVDQSKLLSPVGLLYKPGSSPAPGGTPPGGIPKDLPQTSTFALGKLEADKQIVQLAPGASEQVTLTNGSAGVLVLELGYPLTGIEAKLDRSRLGQGQKAVLTLQAGKEPKPGTYSLRIMPTQEVIGILVQVK